MKRAWFPGTALLISLVPLAPLARADDPPAPLAGDELGGLVERALAAAVTSCGKSFALEDTDARAEGAKPVELAAALRAAAEKAGVRLIAHESNLDVPMLRAHLSTLVAVTAKETERDDSLYLEVEAPDRTLLHANVTNVHRSAPGGPPSGRHTSLALDGFADYFTARWFAKGPPVLLSVVGLAATSSIPQRSLVERIIQRLLAGKATVVAEKIGPIDVLRPKNVRLSVPQARLTLWLDSLADESEIDVHDLPSQALKLHLKYPPTPNGVPDPRVRMKRLGESIADMFNNDGYRVKRTSAEKGKVWMLEVQADPGTPDALRSALDASVRSGLSGRKLAHWTFEPREGRATLADARAANVDVIVTPFYRTKGPGKREVQIEVRSTADDKVLDAPSSAWVEGRQ